MPLVVLISWLVIYSIFSFRHSPLFRIGNHEFFIESMWEIKKIISMSISKQFSAAAAALFFVVMLLPVANGLAQRPPGAFPGAGGPPKPGYVANGFGKISGTVTDE